MIYREVEGHTVVLEYDHTSGTVKKWSKLLLMLVKNCVFKEMAPQGLWSVEAVGTTVNFQQSWLAHGVI